MSIAELNRKLDSLEEQITEKNINTFVTAQKKLEKTSKCMNTTQNIFQLRNYFKMQT